MEGYGFDTQKEIKSVLRWKENTNCYLLGEKNAPTIPSCWHRYFMKKHHLNVKGGFTLYVVGKDGLD